MLGIKMPRNARFTSSAQALSLGGVKYVISRLSLLLCIIVCIVMIFFVKEENKAWSALRNQTMRYMISFMDIASHPVTSFTNFVEAGRSLLHAHRENYDLKAENHYLQQKLWNHLHIEHENEKLREISHFMTVLNTSYSTARVVSETKGPFIRSMLINKTADVDIKKGQAVVNEKGLIGRIIEVGDNYARILQITDINSRIPVLTHISKQKAILTGNNASLLKILYLDPEASLHENEMVFTSGDDNIFPQGIPVGIIIRSPEGEWSVNPLVSASGVDYVSIINKF